MTRTRRMEYDVTRKEARPICTRYGQALSIQAPVMNDTTNEDNMLSNKALSKVPRKRRLCRMTRSRETASCP